MDMFMYFMAFVAFGILIYQNGRDVFVTKENVVPNALLLLLSVFFGAQCLRDAALQVPYHYGMFGGLIMVVASAIFYPVAEAKDNTLDKVFYGVVGVLGMFNIIGSSL